MYWYNEEITRLENKAIVKTKLKKVAFYGSSSFTRWNKLEADFKSFQAINLGFGGSTLAACAWFYNRVVPRHNPDAVVIYSGDNDIGDGRTPEEVVLFFRQLVAEIRKTLGDIPIFFISIKLSPSREHLVGSIDYANNTIKYIIDTEKNNCHYIDIYHLMFNDLGFLDQTMFEKDGLHVSPKGYEIWQSVISKKINSILKK
jgi:lysophospholipase L1-like esterase